MAKKQAPSEPRPVRPPRNWKVVARMGGFHREVGFELDPLATGEGVGTVRGVVEKKHLNINGVVHGGVYATILDTAMGAAVVSLLAKGEVTATTSLYVEFLRPAREGHELVARGEVQRRGRHLAFVRGLLTDAEGVTLGQAQGTWYIWSEGDGTWQGHRGKAPAAKGRPRSR
ncbi:MAG: PaaI family thioesterase [Thermoplasmata archaeon]|nr:PaaI family thioesterase [Thermoplasmata archaeon]